MKKTLLVVDDEAAHRMMVRAVMEDAGWKVLEADRGEEALRLLSGPSGPSVQVALVDMKMPGMDGEEVLARLRITHPHLPVVMLTAYGSVGSAVQAMKKGAFDYLTKPTDNEELAAVLEKALAFGRLLDENQRLKSEAGQDRGLIGDSAPMRRVKDMIGQAGPSEATILVLGESGTGKELVAEALHAASARAKGPLVKVNCAALPADLLESELFGYVKGAFTGAVKDKPGRFQLAEGGTLFLDEIGELSQALQAKLLRALQEKTVEPLGAVAPRTVDARIIAATNRSLREEVAAGRFREDLFFRLSVLEIPIPPLRDRLEDLPALASHLLRKLGRKNNKEIRNVSPAFMEALAAYAWPGNVRELENVLERALILCRTDSLTPDLLPPQIMTPAACPGAAAPASAPAPSLEQAERDALVAALSRHGGHRERTAESLGLSRRTLQYKLKKYGLSERRGGREEQD